MGILRMDPKIEFKYNPVTVAVISQAASARAGERAVKYIKEELNRADRNDTGVLAGSFESRLISNPLGAQHEIYSVLPPLEPTGRTLADIVNNGTGIYGPYHTPIVSPYGSVMRFNPSRKSTSVGRRGVRNAKKTGRFESAYVYTMTVQGQQGVHYIEKATSRIRLIDFAL